MAENLNLNVNVNTSSAESSVGSLKKQLREAQNEVVALSDKFGATSKEAVIAAKKSAELRDRIGDAKSLTDAFNPDQKFKALTSSLAGVAGGFAAIQGAMGLFGVESDDLQKTLVKVQSAMALSQGLESVGNSIDSFKNLGAVIKTQVVSAFSTLRGAIISTGIGVLAIGLGFLIANFEKVKETLTNLFPGLSKFADKVIDIVRAITDWTGATSEAARLQDIFTKGTLAGIFAIEQTIKILESQNGKEAEIYNQKKLRIQKQISLLTDEKDETIKKRVELNTELTVLDNNEANRIKKNNEDAKKEREERDKKRKEDRLKEQERNDASIKANQEFELKIQQDLLKLDEENAAKKRAIEFQKNEDLISDLDYKNALLDGDFEADQERLTIKAEYIAEQKAIELSNLNLTELERLEIISKYAQKERDIDKSVTESKKAEQQARLSLQMSLFDATSAVINGLGSLFEQGSNASKAAALADIAINTAKGYVQGLDIAQKGAAATGPAAPYAFPIFYATQIAAVLMSVSKARGILSTTKGGGGGGGGGVPSLSSAAPMLPQIPTATTTNLSEQSINDIGNQSVRAYVIESDVTSNQQRITAIRQRARFS